MQNRNGMGQGRQADSGCCGNRQRFRVRLRDGSCRGIHGGRGQLTGITRVKPSEVRPGTSGSRA